MLLVSFVFLVMGSVFLFGWMFLPWLAVGLA